MSFKDTVMTTDDMLKEWDKNLANNTERLLAQKQNETSGLAYLLS